MKVLRSFITLIARWGIAAIFILAAIGKLMNYDQTQAYMASKGFTAIPIFLFGAALLELIGGFSLILGYKARFGATLLFLFLIPTTIIFHDFWNLTGAEKDLMQIMFLKNIAIMGGLLYIICDGPGGIAFDAFSRKKHPEPIPTQPPEQQK
jgi:putative oxidoreductase